MKTFFLILFPVIFSAQQANVNTVSNSSNLSKTGYLITIGLSQSNGTVRFTQSGNLAANLQSVLTDCYTYFKATDNSSDNGTWVQLQAGVNDQAGTPQTGSFGISTLISSRLLNTYNKCAYIIPTAIGGTYIANDVTPSWNSTHTGEYYDRMVNYFFRPALSKCNTISLTPVLLIIHGESDSDTFVHGAAYYAAMNAAITKFRKDSGFPNMKVVITKIRSDYGGTSLGLAGVIQAQLNLQANLSNVYLLETNVSTMALSADGQHYRPITTSAGSPQSAQNLGNAIADLISTF